MRHLVVTTWARKPAREKATARYKSWSRCLQKQRSFFKLSHPWNPCSLKRVRDKMSFEMIISNVHFKVRSEQLAAPRKHRVAIARARIGLPRCGDILDERARSAGVRRQREIPRQLTVSGNILAPLEATTPVRASASEQLLDRSLNAAELRGTSSQLSVIWPRFPFVSDRMLTRAPTCTSNKETKRKRRPRVNVYPERCIPA